MELNREQIMKGLECCSDDNSCYNAGCPYKSDSLNACTSKLSRNALALINELTEENERLVKALDTMSADHNRAISLTETYTVRKMQERLEAVAYQSNDWSHGEHPMVVELDDIDQIAKDMLEDT
jgi:hypothetical protein